MLAHIAFWRGMTCHASEAPLYDASLGLECFLLCQVLLNSTRLLVPPGEPSSSRITSRSNSIRFSDLGIGYLNSAK
ncbi:hypothetical protein ACFX13_028161 [Malus domestica]